MSCIPITHSLVRRLRDAYPDHMAGIKDSAGEWENTASFIRAFPDLCIFPGSEGFLLRGLQAGAAGCISASANVNAATIRAAYDAWASGSSEAEALQREINSLRNIFETAPLIPALKHIMAHYRDDPGWRRLRPPLVPLHASSEETLLSSLAAAGYQFPPHEK